jgi:hypothetical protein
MRRYDVLISPHNKGRYGIKKAAEKSAARKEYIKI